MTVEMKKYKLGDIAKIYDGPHATPKKIDQGPIYLGINAVTEDCRIDPNGLAFLSEEDYKVWTKRVTPQHKDIVFSYEATLGRYAIIPENFYGCLGRRLGIVRVVDAKVNYEWLFYYFQSPQWKSFIKNHTIKGSTVDRISVEEMPNYEIPAIDISKQNRIALVLSTLDKRIENLRAQNRVLEQTAKTIYDYTFLQCAGHQTTYNKTLNRNIPTNWSVGKIGDICDIKSGFPFKSETYLTNGMFGIVTIKNVQDHKLDLTSLDYIDEKPARLPDYCVLSVGDALISLTGNCGRICRVEFENLLLNQRVGKIISKIGVPYYVYMIFDEIYVQKKIQYLANGAAQANVSPIDIQKIEVAIPDARTLENFNAQVATIFQKQHINTKQIETLTTQRNTLLPLLMTGQVEVT